MPSLWPSARLAALCCALLAGCDPEITGDRAARHGRVQLDLGLQDGAVSVADRVVLEVVPAVGGPQRAERQVGRGQFEASFQVSAPEGPAQFRVEVLNRAGAPVLRGEATVPVDRDGFSVDLLLQAPGSFLVARPGVVAGSSVEASLGFLSGELTLRNAGTAALTWRSIEAVPATPGPGQIARCGASGRPCLFVTPDTGSLAPQPVTEREVRVRLRAISTGALLYRLRLASSSGELDVEMSAPAALAGRAAGAVALDGVVSPGEWGSAASFPFKLPVTGGDSIPGTFRIMNDSEFLYLAATLERDPAGLELESYLVGVLFDDDADGVPAARDDALVARLSRSFSRETSSHVDAVRSDLPPCLADWGTVAGLQTREPRHGDARASFEGRTVTLEMRRPLASRDTLNDVSLGIGQAVGVQFCAHAMLARGSIRTVSSLELPVRQAAAFVVQ